MGKSKVMDLFSAYTRDKLLYDLFTAYYDARRNKRNTHNALNFELHYESSLIQLCDEIVKKDYHPRRSIAFIVNKPVKREIFAADFRDRIVHHLIFNYISEIFEEHFINDSYSCRIGKGTHYGIKRVDHFIRSCSANYHKDCYILKIDIKGYFMSIDRSLLYEKVKKTLLKYSGKIDGDIAQILYLIRKTIFNEPVNCCIFKSNRDEWNGLPASKSLFHAKKNKGLPIGNLTSQLFANIYLSEFDHFMKWQLKLRYYGRYVDDIVVVHPDREYLKSVIASASEYLKTNLMLELHPRKVYLQHYTKGVVFLGTVIKPHRIYIANRTKCNFYNAVGKQNEIIRNHKPSKEEKQKFLQSMNSYLGILIHYNTYKLRKRAIYESLSCLWRNHVNLSKGLTRVVLKRKSR